MEKIIWFIIMVPCSAVFTGIGIFAWNRKKPMWFWSGSDVKETEIADIPAYNRANGRMWILFSLPFWVSAVLGFWSQIAAVIVLIAAFLIGFPILVRTYSNIYEKYKA